MIEKAGISPAAEYRNMPSFAESLEKTLHQALHNAADRRHEYATLEHLLLALIDDADAAIRLEYDVNAFLCLRA